MGGSPLFKKILRQCFGNLSETRDCVEGGAPLKYTSPVGEPAGQGGDPTAKKYSAREISDEFRRTRGGRPRK